MSDIRLTKNTLFHLRLNIAANADNDPGITYA